MTFGTRAITVAVLGTGLVLGACSKQPLNMACASGAPPVLDGGGTIPPEDGGVTSTADAGGGPFALQSFKPPSDPGGGGVIFSVSGEVLALQGYPFPPANPGDTAFVDGWAVSFTRLLTTVDDITLSNGPDVNPGDQSCTEPIVAKVTGPWAVDLAHSDPAYLQGKGGPGEEAVPIAALSQQNYPPGNSDGFDTSGGNPYAFGFDVVPATASAMNVNLDAPGLADYAQMAAEGCTVLYVGKATFRGDTSTCTCPTSASATAPCDPSIYGPGLWPQPGDTVPFRLCFIAPTSYLNCQNPDNDPAAPLPGEEHARGIFFKSNQSIVAQVTIHTDHPFWDSVLHDSPTHFDQFAARVVGRGPAGTNVTFPTVTLEMTEGVDFRAVTDALGHQLAWRYCVVPPTDVHNQFVGPMVFDAQTISLAPAGPRIARGLRDYYDYATYNQSTQGHLNSDGLCYVWRHYPSPL